MGEAKVLQPEMLTQRSHYCLGSLFRVIVAVVQNRLVSEADGARLEEKFCTF